MKKLLSMSFADVQDERGDFAAMDMAKKSGADAIDFALFYQSVTKEESVYTKGADAVCEYYRSVREYADKIGLKINQTHGRLSGFGITPERDVDFIKNSEYDILASNILGAKYCVVHTPAITHVGDGLTDDELFGISDRLFSSILPFAKKYGIKIAAETHGDSRKYGKMEFFGHVENLVKCIERIEENFDGKGYMVICVDTGHTNLTVKYGLPTVEEAIRIMGSRIEVLHLHDNSGMRDEHKIVGTGTINFEEVFKALKEVGYSGYYNLENNINHFGGGFEEEESAFCIKALRHMLEVYGV